MNTGSSAESSGETSSSPTTTSGSPSTSTSQPSAPTGIDALRKMTTEASGKIDNSTAPHASKEVAPGSSGSNRSRLYTELQGEIL
jgi:hypothetical protein